MHDSSAVNAASANKKSAPVPYSSSRRTAALNRPNEAIAKKSMDVSHFNVFTRLPPFLLLPKQIILQIALFSVILILALEGTPRAGKDVIAIEGLLSGVIALFLCLR